MKVADIIAEAEMSKAHLYRIEEGTIPVNVKDIWALCRVYRVDGQTTDELTRLAKGTTDRDWWEDYSDALGTGVSLFVGLEEVADEILSYEAELVPGLFQVADYTREVNRAERPNLTDSAISRRADLRQERQRKVLERAQPPRITAVLNAAVLTRQVGGPGVMAAQRRRLREFSALDHVDIRVVPWNAGAHASMGKPFTILGFRDTAYPTVVHVDGRTGGKYMERREHLDEYRETFDLVREKSVPLEEYDTS